MSIPLATNEYPLSLHPLVTLIVYGGIQSSITTRLAEEPHAKSRNEPSEATANPSEALCNALIAMVLNEER